MKSYNMIPFLELLGPPDLYHGSAGALLGVEGVVWSEECSGGCRSKIPGCKLSFWREVWKEISCVPCSFCCHVILISWWTGSEHLSWRCDRDPKWLRYWGFVSQLNVNGIITMLVHLRKMIKAKRAQCSVSCSEWLDISIMLCCNQLSRWWGEGSLPVGAGFCRWKVGLKFSPNGSSLKINSSIPAASKEEGIAMMTIKNCIKSWTSVQRKSTTIHNTYAGDFLPMILNRKLV